MKFLNNFSSPCLKLQKKKKSKTNLWQCEKKKLFSVYLRLTRASRHRKNRLRRRWREFSSKTRQLKPRKGDIGEPPPTSDSRTRHTRQSCSVNRFLPGITRARVCHFWFVFLSPFAMLLHTSAHTRTHTHDRGEIFFRRIYGAKGSIIIKVCAREGENARLFSFLTYVVFFFSFVILF